MALPQYPLFTGADISGALHRPVSDDDVAAAEKIVWGRVKALLNLTERPAELDDTLAGLVLELGIIAYTNPEALAQYILEAEQSTYETGRWDEILEAIANGGTVAPGSALRPVGSFPPPRRYPDPAEWPRRRCW